MLEVRPQLEAGFAKLDITPPVGGPLSGMIAPRGRRSTAIHDPLFARALTIKSGDERATLLVADLLTIPAALHRAVARRTGLDESRLLVSATHTHSGPGGYWDVGRRAALITGTYDRATFETLVDRLCRVVEASAEHLAPTTVEAAAVPVPGANANRRQLYGPTDPDLTLVRFETEGAPTIDLVSFSAHPVIVSERAPTLVSADYPGALCDRIEAHGHRALFFQGAVGAMSPLFPEFPLQVDPHLDLVAGLLERGWEDAGARLQPVPGDGPIHFETLRLDMPPVRPRFFPDGVKARGHAERALVPLARFVRGLGEAGRKSEPDAPLHLFRIGDVALLGTPCDLGVSVSLALKRALAARGIPYGIPGSQCDGYVGYVLMPEDYAHVPEAGFRFLAFYENGMSFGGWNLGAEFVAATRDRLALD